MVRVGEGRLRKRDALEGVIERERQTTIFPKTGSMNNLRWLAKFFLKYLNSKHSSVLSLRWKIPTKERSWEYCGTVFGHLASAQSS